MKNQRRFFELDYLRGIAMLMVVMGHVLNFGLDIPHSTAMSLFGLCEMPIFFAVSGFLSYKEELECNQDGKCAETGISTVLRRFGKRSMGLLVPLAVWSFVLNISKDHTTPSLSIIYGGGYWFFAALWWCDLINAVFSIVSARYRFRMYADFFVLGIVYSTIVFLRVRNINLGGLLPIHNIQYYYPFFVMGIMIRKYDLIKRLIFNRYTYGVGLLLSGVSLFFSGLQSYLVFLTGAMGSVIVAWMICKSLNEEYHAVKLLGYLGRNTLPIYSIHYLFLSPLPLCVREMCLVPMGFTLQVTVSLAFASIIIGLCLLVNKLLAFNSITKMLFFGQFSDVSKIRKC